MRAGNKAHKMKMKCNILKLDSNAKYTNNNSLTKSINRNVALLNDLEKKHVLK